MLPLPAPTSGSFPADTAIVSSQANSRNGAQRMIIYTYKRHMVNEIAKTIQSMLAKEGDTASSIQVSTYVGARDPKDQEARQKAQREFTEGHTKVMVANEAFGMGIDHPHIRRVVCIGPPKS